MARTTSKSNTTTESASTEYQERKAFIDLFSTIAKHRHRYDIFKDFVTMSAITLHNAIRKDAALEAEYMSIEQRYTKEESLSFSHLFAMLVNMLEPAPRDVLGTLFMELNFGGTHNGQFFTPHHISELMAQIGYGEQLENLKQPFVTLCEPACGAGGMVLAFARVMIDKGHNPASRLWVQCQDIDRTAALMCYVQLALWHIPGVVIVGDTLANEQREVFYTPAHYLEDWTTRLKWRSAIERVKTVITKVDDAEPSVEAHVEATPPEQPSVQTLSQPAQFDFEF